MIFSKDANEWGAFSYKQEDDALRIQAKPQPAEFRERMAFDFDDVTDTSAKVVLHWEKLKVPFTVEVDTPALVAAKVKEAVRWQTPYQAANYCIQNNTCLDDASRWLDASIALAGELRQPPRQGHAARQEERPRRLQLRPAGARRREDRSAGAGRSADQGSGRDRGGEGGSEEGEVRLRRYVRAVAVAARAASQAPRSTT